VCLVSSSFCVKKKRQIESLYVLLEIFSLKKQHAIQSLFQVQALFFHSESSSCKEKEQREREDPSPSQKDKTQSKSLRAIKTIEWELPFLARI
jgi:hypothetical protein